MAFSINKKRKETMLRRIGDAADLVDNQKFLPFFRSVQIKLEKLGKSDEWQRMIKAAKTKNSPGKYFAELCKRVRNGTYQFVDKAKEITGEAALYISDKIIHFGFGKFQKYWVRRCNEFIKLNSMAGFVELLDYARRKNLSAKYFARAIMNGKPPREYYKQNIVGVR